MATPDTVTLAARSRTELADLRAAWPPASPTLRVTVVEPVHALSLRHWPGLGTAALATFLASRGLLALPEPGRFAGVELRLVWSRPSETLLLTQDGSRAAAVLNGLRPVPGALACAIDLSAAALVVALQGSAVDALLMRLIDVDSLPRVAGHASRVRLVDIAATVWREAPDRLGMLVDRANDHYLARWLSYALDGV